MTGLVEALRERVTPRSVLLTAAIAAVWTVTFDGSPARVAATVLATALVGAGEVLADAYDLGPLSDVSLGVATVLGAGALAAFDDAHPVAPLVAGVVGSWVLLDGVQSLRHGPPGESGERTPADGRTVYRQYVAGRVQQALDERPRTRRELHETLDADDDVVDDALALLDARDAVVREGSAYRRADPPAEGALDGLGGWLRRRASRLARPLTVELGGGDHAAGDDPGDSQTDVEDPAAGWGDRSATVRGDESEDERADLAERDR